MTKLEQLRAQLLEASGTMKAITDAADADGKRPLTPEEQADWKAANDNFTSLENEIAIYERTEQVQARTAAPQARVVQPIDSYTGTQSATPVPQAGRPSVTGGGLVAHNYANRGFKHAGDFLQAVRRVATTNIVDPRLITSAATTYGSEGTNADGGFALPPQYAQGLIDAVMPQDSFLQALNPIYTNSNLLVVPANENPAWSASGITAAKTAEGGAITQSKPAIKQVQVVMHSIKALVSVSDEALDDMPFLSSWVMQQMAEHIRYKMEYYVVQGNGLNEPLGFLNAPGLKTVSDGDSTATQLGHYDALSMEAGLLPGQGSFWLAGPTVLPAVANMNTGSGGVALFHPDATVAPKRTLLGRPYYVSEACKAWNTTGDIFVINPSGYIFALKSAGVQTATSIHFFFDQALTSFRATVRMGGAPLLSAVVTRADGSSTASHIVTMASSRS